MTSRIVYNGFHKILRYEMTQQGDIEEPLNEFKSYQTPIKENSNKDRFSEEKKYPNEDIIHASLIIYQKNH